MYLTRVNGFVLITAAAFLLPLAIPGVGLDWIYFFMMVIFLIAWFVLKWNAVKKITEKSRWFEVVPGLSVIGAIYAYNAFLQEPVGIVDLLVIFLASVVTSFGFGALKKFWVPAAFGVVLLAGYQIENIIPNYVALQDWLAGVLVSLLNALGIEASANGHVVSMVLQNGTFAQLDIDTGLQGILAFGLVSAMALLNTKLNLRRLIPIFAIGLVGAFLVNIVRLLVICLTFFRFGEDAGIAMDVYFGYVVFFVWVLAFWAIAFRYLVPRQRPSLQLCLFPNSTRPDCRYDMVAPSHVSTAVEGAVSAAKAWRTLSALASAAVIPFLRPIMLSIAPNRLYPGPEGLNRVIAQR